MANPTAMRRGIVGTLLLALAIGVTPAGAAPAAAPAAAQVVVYEVVRTTASPATAPVRIHNDSRKGEAVTMYANLQPDGSGYRYRRAGTSWTSHGWTSWSEFEVDLSPGWRFLVGGIRGRVRVEPRGSGWVVREAGRGFRVVSTAPGDRGTAGPVEYERFGGATAPAGPYGSLAYAHVPCMVGAGTWTFATDAEPWSGPPRVCAASPFGVGSDAEFEETRRGRTWIVDADVIGVNGWPVDVPDVRIVVLDYPKRPASR